MPDSTICRDTIAWFEINSENKSQPGNIGVGNLLGLVDHKVKESTDIQLTVEEAYVYEAIKKPMCFLWECILNYTKEFDGLNETAFALTERFNIQKYTPPTGGFKQFHCERASIKVADRMLVWMIYLNTVTDKGETEFKYQKHKEKAVEGKVVVFPCDFTHTHKGIVSPTQVKYLMTGWYNWIDSSLYASGN